MNQQLFIQLCEIILFFTICIGVFMILVASIYDISAISRRRHFRSLVHALRYPRQPSITVLVYAYNNEATITACLRYLEKSRYRNYDIVVVDAMSSDATRRILRLYKEKYQKSSVYVYTKRKPSSRMLSLQQGYMKSKKGELVLVLDGANIVQPTLLKASAARFVRQPKLLALQLNMSINSPWSIVSLMRRFTRLGGNVLRKCLSILSKNRIRIGKAGVVYRRAVFQKKSSFMAVPSTYDNDLIISEGEYSQNIQLPMLHFRYARVSFIVSFMLLAIVCVMTYTLYTAATLQTSMLLIASWVIVGLWFLVVIWSEETSKFGEKITLTFSLPVLYFLLYFQLLFSLLAIYVRAVKVFVARIAGHPKSVDQIDSM